MKTRKPNLRNKEDLLLEPYEFEVSLVDLLEPEEGGPVLRRRPPEAPRFPYHPEEMVYKEALGLTDVPKAGPYGSVISRPRESYEDQDFEVANKTGFGGPSVIDVTEDKPPVNIRRKTINKTDKPVEYAPTSYFDWLYSGKLRRKIGDKMSSRIEQLLKLAKALELSGYNTQSSEIYKVAQASGNIAGLDQLQSFKKYWSSIPITSKSAAKLDPNKAFAQAASGGMTGIGTDEDLMIAAVFYGTDPKSSIKLGGTPLKDAFADLEWGFESFLGTFSSYQNWNDWWQILDREIDSSYYLRMANIARSDVVHKYFDPESGEIKQEAQAELPPVSKDEPKDVGTKKQEPSKTPKPSESKPPQAKAVPSSRLHYPAETRPDGPIHSIQKELGVDVDGKFGPITYAAYTKLVGKSELPKDPNAALSMILSEKESKTSKVPGVIFDDEVLVGYLLTKSGEIPGLDLTARSRETDSFSIAETYVSNLNDDAKETLSEMVMTSITGNRAGVETALRNLYSTRKEQEAASEVEAEAPIAEDGESKFKIDLAAGKIYKMIGTSQQEVSKLSPKERNLIMKSVPFKDKMKVQKILRPLVSKASFADFLRKEGSKLDGIGIAKTAQHYGASEARKNRLSKIR